MDGLDYAVELYRQGYARRLFVSGACGQSREQALAAGVRPDDLSTSLLGAATTYEEALELKEFLDGNPSVQSVIVVSSLYQMRLTTSWVPRSNLLPAFFLECAEIE